MLVSYRDQSEKGSVRPDLHKPSVEEGGQLRGGGKTDRKTRKEIENEHRKGMPSIEEDEKRAP